MTGGHHSVFDHNYITLYLEDIPNGRLVDYLIASSSLPIFNLDRIDDKLFCFNRLWLFWIAQLKNAGFKW